jgi:uncharacterized protein (DUF302 family)
MAKIFSILIPLILSLGAASLAQTSQDPHSSSHVQMFLQTESPKGLSETVEVFKEEVAGAGWSILNMNNMAGILSEKGYTISPVLIFDVCSGKYSARILAEDEYRFVTPLMPCRVSIYQTSQGKVVIARLNPKGFGPMLSDELAEIMMQSSMEIEDIIEKTISRLTDIKSK